MGAAQILIILTTVIWASDFCIGENSEDGGYRANCTAAPTRCDVAQNLTCAKGLCECRKGYFNLNSSNSCDPLTNLVIVTSGATYLEVRQTNPAKSVYCQSCRGATTRIEETGAMKFNGLDQGRRYELKVKIENSSWLMDAYTLPAEPTNFTEEELGNGIVRVNWTQKGQIENLNVSCNVSPIGSECKCTSLPPSNTMSCKLKELVQVTVFVTVTLHENNSTGNHTLRYIRIPDVANITNTSVTTISINLTVLETGPYPIGRYVINITSSNAQARCVYFERDASCRKVNESCEPGSYSSRTNTTTTVDANGGGGTTTYPVNINDSNPQRRSTGTENTKILNLEVSGLKPATQYILTLIPWFCNFSVQHGNPLGPINITTDKLASGEMQHSVRGRDVDVSFNVSNLPPGVTSVNYTVWLKDDLAHLNVSSNCSSSDQNTLLCSQQIVDNNGACSGKAPYAFWEYYIVIETFPEGIGIPPSRVITGVEVPGEVTNLRQITGNECKEVCRDPHKICITWREVCPRNRRDFIEAYIVSVFNKDKVETRYNSSLQGYIATRNDSEYRRDVRMSEYCHHFDAVPGVSYQIEVWALTPNNIAGTKKAITASVSITESPEIPAANRLVPKESIKADRTTLQFTMTNTSFLSDESRGRLKSKGMVVAPNWSRPGGPQIVGPSDYDKLLNYREWEKYSRHRRNRDTQRSDLYYRVDFKEVQASTDLIVILGDNEPQCETLEACQGPTNCKLYYYCDGPLDPGTPYTVWVFLCNEQYCAVVRVIDNQKTSPEEKVTDEELAPLVIVVLILGVVAWMAIGVLAYLLCFRKSRRQRPLSEFDSGSAGLPLRPRNTKPMVLVNLETTVAKKQRDDGLLLREEYEEIRSCDIRYPCDTSLLEINRPKNRFADIMAFDHTRVKLSLDEQGGDYINANYVPGYTRDDEYIATQGPLPSTVNDFWRMVWEHRVPIIVMLTPTMEKGQIKCEQYWPSTVGEVRQYGSIIVTSTSVSCLNEYNITIFSLKHETEDEEHEVVHFHYLKWPDMTADVQLQTLLQFVHFVRQYVRPDRSGPMVVHCSAGVGRTGTFICIDYVMQFINERPVTEYLDIYGFILRLRKYRSRMVQTESQYILVHQCARNLMAARRQKDAGLAADTLTPVSPLANGFTQALLANPTRNGSAGSDGGEEQCSDSPADVTQVGAIEMETCMNDALVTQPKEEAPVEPEGDTDEEEEDMDPEHPLACSSLDLLYSP